MKSILPSILFWIFVLHSFCNLMTFGMKESENEDIITYTSKKDLENNFMDHWKNPEKYVAFKFNDETFPNASGFYVLRPYYQKLKICTGEKEDYSIEYSSYDKNWRLIRNPFDDPDPIVETLELKDTTIATLLEGEEFSFINASEEDIQAFKTFKNAISKNKKLKIEIELKEQEIESLKKSNEDFTINYEDLMTTNDDLNNRLINGTKRFKKLKNDNQLLKNDNQLLEDEKKLGFVKHAEILDENENLQKELEKQKNKIENQKKEIETLTNQLGGLSYNLSKKEDAEKELESLKKEIDPLKNANKKLNQEIKQLKSQLKMQLADQFNQFKMEISDQNRVPSHKSLKGKQKENDTFNSLLEKEMCKLSYDIYKKKAQQEVDKHLESLKEELDPLKKDMRTFVGENGSNLKQEMTKLTHGVKSLEEKFTVLTDAINSYANVTKRYELLLTKVEQNILTESIERLKIMENKNHFEEINQLKEKLDLKKQSLKVSDEFYNSEISFLEIQIKLESELLKVFIVKKMELTNNAEQIDTAEVETLESRIRLYQKASENETDRLKDCRNAYLKFQQTLVEHEENYAKINQLLAEE